MRIGQVYDSHLATIAAAEKCGLCVVAFGDESLDGGNDGHACEASSQRLYVCGEDSGSVRPMR